MSSFKVLRLGASLIQVTYEKIEAAPAIDAYSMPLLGAVEEGS